MILPKIFNIKLLLLKNKRFVANVISVKIQVYSKFYSVISQFVLNLKKKINNTHILKIPMVTNKSNVYIVHINCLY